MPQIRIDTEQVRDVGRRLIAEGDRLSEIGHELHGAIGNLDTGAWDGHSRAQAEPLLGRVRPESARVSEDLDELGRTLVRVADTFEQEDNTAARNLEGMPWVDFGLSAGMAGFAGGGGGGGGGGMGTDSKGSANAGVEFEEGFAGRSTSYDLKDKERQTESEVEVKIRAVDGALYDAEDITGDVKIGTVDVGDYEADVKAGKYEAGAKFGLGEHGFTAGAYGEIGSGEATAAGVVGGSGLGIAAAGAVAGPKAEGFIGLKDNTIGISVGGSLVSAEAEAGLNIAGANVGVKGGVSVGIEFGFKIGQDTEVKFGPFKIGISFGKAKGSKK